MNPTLTATIPTAFSTTGGLLVTISGTGFPNLPATPQVRLSLTGGGPYFATATWVSASALTFVAPNTGSVTGTATLSVAMNGVNYATSTATATMFPAPTYASSSVHGGPTTGTTNGITITGTNLQFSGLVTTVRFGSLVSSPTVTVTGTALAPSQIVVAAPTAAAATTLPLQLSLNGFAEFTPLGSYQYYGTTSGWGGDVLQAQPFG